MEPEISLLHAQEPQPNRFYIKRGTLNPSGCGYRGPEIAQVISGGRIKTLRLCSEQSDIGVSFL
jgi:hypothetical protein